MSDELADQVDRGPGVLGGGIVPVPAPKPAPRPEDDGPANVGVGDPMSASAAGTQVFVYRSAAGSGAHTPELHVTIAPDGTRASRTVVP